MNVTEYLALPAVQRRRLRLVPKRRGAYRNRQAVKEWRADRDRLTGFLRQNNIRSSVQLQRMREYDRATPTTADYQIIFGSWKNAVVEAFGKPVQPAFKVEFTAQYAVKCLIQLNLWNRRKFLLARKAEPDVIPSARFVITEFGSWGSLKHCAESYGLAGELWLALALRLHRVPTNFEVQQAGIDLSHLQEIHGSRESLNDFLLKLFEIAQRKNVSTQLENNFATFGRNSATPPTDSEHSKAETASALTA